MPMHLGKRTATLTGPISVEDVEPLIAWLGDTRRPAVNLRRCTHLHTAILQALLAARVQVSAPPADPFLLAWILPILKGAIGGGGSDKEPAP